MIFAKRSLSSSTRSAILFINFARSLGAVLDQPSNALLAASMASFVSFSPPCWTLANVSPVAGLTTSTVPSEPSSHLPLI